LASRADYQFELDGSYSEINGSDANPENLNLSGEWFFKTIDDSQGPLAEAGFLSGESSLSYAFDRTESQFFVFRSPGTDSRRVASRGHDAALRYVFPESGWIISAGGNFTNPPNFPTAENNAVDSDQYGLTLGVGRYLNRFTTLELFARYDESSTKNTLSVECLQFFIADPNCQRIEQKFNFESEAMGISAQFRRVGRIGRAIFSTTARIGYTDIDATNTTTGFEVVGEVSDTGLLPLIPANRTSANSDSWDALLAGSWYPLDQLGFDLNYTFSSFGPQDNHGVGVGFGWFINPTFEVRGNHSWNFSEGGGAIGIANDDTRQWRATLRARF